MKAAAKISPVATRGREATADIDWDECFICQDPRNTSKANRLRDATSAGIEILVEAEAWYLPNDQKIAEANTQDLAWIMARQHQPDDQVVPGWSGFTRR
ncbi:hypothetical protein ACOMHN_060832 [Nucella lapillus]